jgi:hypothetical protein
VTFCDATELDSAVLETLCGVSGTDSTIPNSSGNDGDRICESDSVTFCDATELDSAVPETLCGVSGTDSTIPETPQRVSETVEFDKVLIGERGLGFLTLVLTLLGVLNENDPGEWGTLCGVPHPSLALEFDPGTIGCVPASDELRTGVESVFREDSVDI